MVDDVVQVVATEGLDGELAAVRPDPAPLPRQRRHRRVEVGHGVRGSHQGRPDDRRQLAAVATLDGRLVLVPVREVRGVLGEHRRHPVVEDLVDVVHVAGVLEGRPAVGTRAHRRPRGSASSASQTRAFARKAPGEVDALDRRARRGRTPRTAARAPRSSPWCRVRGPPAVRSSGHPRKPSRPPGRQACDPLRTVARNDSGSARLTRSTRTVTGRPTTVARPGGSSSSRTSPFDVVFTSQDPAQP